jgi:hypothetical protein
MQAQVVDHYFPVELYNLLGPLGRACVEFRVKLGKGLSVDSDHAIRILGFMFLVNFLPW